LTADLLDNTGGANTDARYVQTADLGDLTGRKFTYSLWIRADTPHTASIRLYEAPAAGDLCGIKDIFITTEWQRFICSGTAVGGGNNRLAAYIYPGEQSVATGVVHAWGANLTETTFPVSYIKNAGAGTTQVTRTADSMTIDPHPEVGNRILPEEFNESGVLTVEFDAKCEWSESADMSYQAELVEIGGNTGTASSTRNRLTVFVSTAGRVQSWFRDDADVDHTTQTGIDPVDFSQWHTYKYFVDFSDLSRMNAWIDGTVYVTAYALNSGVATFDATNTLVRVGQNYAGGPHSYCQFRNLRISPSEF